MYKKVKNRYKFPEKSYRNACRRGWRPIWQHAVSIMENHLLLNNKDTMMMTLMMVMMMMVMMVLNSVESLCSYYAKKYSSYDFLFKSCVVCK